MKLTLFILFWRRNGTVLMSESQILLQKKYSFFVTAIGLEYNDWFYKVTII
jgi:hypothetical protein